MLAWWELNQPGLKLFSVFKPMQRLTFKPVVLKNGKFSPCAGGVGEQAGQMAISNILEENGVAFKGSNSTLGKH